MNDDLAKKGEEIAEILARADRNVLEFEKLEQEYIGVDREEVLNYMEENGIKSAAEAYSRMNGLEEPASQGVQPTDTSGSFMKNMAKAFAIEDQAPASTQLGESTPQAQNNSHFDNLRNQMRDYFNRGGAK